MNKKKVQSKERTTTKKVQQKASAKKVQKHKAPTKTAVQSKQKTTAKKQLLARQHESVTTKSQAETKWNECADAPTMLDYLGDYADEATRHCRRQDAGQISHRKSWLLALACCKRIEHLLPNKQTKAVLKALERYLEGKGTAEQVEQARTIASDGGRRVPGRNEASKRAFSAVVLMGDSVQHTIMTAAVAVSYMEPGPNEEKAQADLVRDIFGNPYRPVTLDPSWVTSTVKHLAEAIYTEKAFDRLPILADALEDAGCTSQYILDHCRQPGEHARGCWALDVILRRE